MKRLIEMAKRQAKLIDDVLTRYTEDEAGQAQKEKYLQMKELDKISLLTNVLETCASWEDFETDIVINFDYNNY